MTYARVPLATSMTVNDTQYQAWVTAVDAAILATGMVATSDTGQLDIAGNSYVRPDTSLNAGYRMYRFSDTLQASAPIFLRVDYGMSPQASLPQLTFTLGAQTNGSGTISQKSSGSFQRRLYNATRIGPPLIAVEQVSSGSMSAGALGGRATIAFDLAANVDNLAHLLHIERLRDADGVPNDRGWWYYALGPNAVSSGSQRYGFCQTVATVTTQYDVIGQGWTGPLPAVRAEGQGQGGTENSDVPVGMVFPSSGRLWYSVMLLMAPGRVTAMQTLPIDHLDGTHTYMNLGSNFNQRDQQLSGMCVGTVVQVEHVLVPWE